MNLNTIYPCLGRQRQQNKSTISRTSLHIRFYTWGTLGVARYISVLIQEMPSNRGRTENCGARSIKKCGPKFCKSCSFRQVLWLNNLQNLTSGFCLIYRSKAHHACNKTHSGSLNKLQEIGFLLPSFLP
jgi:hypothetical protein